MENNCCLCGMELEGLGHNAFPLDEGKCCDSCNYLSVIPAMIEEAHHSGKFAGGEDKKSGLLRKDL